MPTLSQKQDGNYIIRSQIRGGIISTWQVDDKRGIFLLRDRGYNINVGHGTSTEFPVEVLMELIQLKYISTQGSSSLR